MKIKILYSILAILAITSLGTGYGWYQSSGEKVAYILKRNWDNHESSGYCMEVKFLPEEAFLRAGWCI
ncbi:hypothetical protein [Parablautia muri]|uniref:Uncharacterized protein n=1 Tax=Parablautia muri TaxID=2320879 RepID=A0A9X5GQ24_9FIRM|nr:hypothetical protein [Parablautia muri]NBJ91463.1 hypothetical protein [Parablautia muri]